MNPTTTPTTENDTSNDARDLPRRGPREVAREAMVRKGGWGLRGRLGVLAGIGVVMVVVVAVVGWMALSRLQHANDELDTLSLAQRQHQDGNLMFDAMRADAYLALLSAQGSVDLPEGEVRSEVVFDAQLFRVALAANQSLDLAPQARAEINSVVNPLEDYIVQATLITQLAYEDLPQALATIPEFNETYRRLGDAQQTVSDTLDRLVSEQAEAGNDAKRQAGVVLIVAAALAAIVLISFAFLLGRWIVRSLIGIGDVARSIAAGELHIRARQADHEIGTLAHAINEMADDLQVLVRRMESASERDGFSARLAEALEMADTETEVLDVTTGAMSLISATTPMEVLLSDSSKAHLERVAEHGRAGPPCCPVESPFNCVALRRGSPVVFESSEELNACPKLRGRGAGPISAVCVPVTFMGRALGVLHATGTAGSPPAPDAVIRLTALATQAGARIGTVRSFERSQLQATTDGLTGLRNRRTFESELRRLLLDGHDLTLVLADLDHFKLLNDTYGHEAGDRALRRFAQLLDGSLRDSDLCARFGGEEFVVAFPDTSPNVAIEVIDRLRQSLSASGDVAGMPAFTASFGVVDTTMADSLELLLGLADSALYRAKHEGRNRVVIADGADAASMDHRETAPTVDPGSPIARSTRHLASMGAFARAAELDDPVPAGPVQR